MSAGPARHPRTNQARRCWTRPQHCSFLRVAPFPHAMLRCRPRVGVAARCGPRLQSSELIRPRQTASGAAAASTMQHNRRRQTHTLTRWNASYQSYSLQSPGGFRSPLVAQFHSRSSRGLLSAEQSKTPPSDANQTATATPSEPTATPSGTPSSSPSTLSSRSRSSGSKTRSGSSNSNLLQYLVGLTVLVIGASWAAVPLYRAFCAHTGYGGTTQSDKDGSKLATMKPSKKEVTVMFNADVSPAMHWKFVPSQASLKVKLGEPVLAFYKATNLRDKPITGVATYNIVPMKAGLYFHKIQCFCFDEQRLRAKETVDMPVFFYIDPAMEQDVRTGDVTHLTLSYTFFPVDDSEEDEDPSVTAERDQHSGIRIHGPGVIPPQFAAAAEAAAGTMSTPIDRSSNASTVAK